MVFTSKEMEKNFWKKVKRTENHNECWEWIGGIDKNTGYGKFRDGTNVDVAHRVIYRHCYGELSKEKPIVRHLCNNRKCCNPRHLEDGSYYDNWMDSVKAGTAKPFAKGFDARRKNNKSEEDKKRLSIKLKIRWEERKASAHPEVQEVEDKDKMLDGIIFEL